MHVRSYMWGMTKFKVTVRHKGSTLALKPRADITRSTSGPQKVFMSAQNKKKGATNFSESSNDELQKQKLYGVKFFGHFILCSFRLLIFSDKPRRGRKSRRSESDPDNNMTSSDPDFSESEMLMRGQNLTQCEFFTFSMFLREKAWSSAEWYIFTARVRSTREGNIFTGVCPSTEGGKEGTPAHWSPVSGPFLGVGGEYL